MPYGNGFTIGNTCNPFNISTFILNIGYNGTFTEATFVAQEAKLTLSIGGSYGFSSGSSTLGSDTAISRNAAGVLEINNGTTGVFRDLKLRSLIATAGSATDIPATINLASSHTADSLQITSSGGTAGDILKITHVGSPGTGGVRFTTGTTGYSGTSLQIEPHSFAFNVQASADPRIIFDLWNSKILQYVNMTFGWSAGSPSIGGSLDTAISRNAAGVLEINNGTTGVFRDLKLRDIDLTGCYTRTKTYVTGTEVYRMPVVDSNGRLFTYADNSNYSFGVTQTFDGNYGVLKVGRSAQYVATGDSSSSYDSTLAIACGSGGGTSFLKMYSGHNYGNFTIRSGGGQGTKLYNSDIVALTLVNSLVGVGNVSIPSAQLQIGVSSSSTIGQQITLASGQTANAFEVNSYGGSGGDKFKISSSGDVTLPYATAIDFSSGGTIGNRGGIGGGLELTAGTIMLKSTIIRLGSYGDTAVTLEGPNSTTETLTIHPGDVGNPGIGSKLILRGGHGNSSNNNGGAVYLFGGSKAGSGSDGNVILAHNGTNALGLVSIGNISPTDLLTVGNGTQAGGVEIKTTSPYIKLYDDGDLSSPVGYIGTYFNTSINHGITLNAENGVNLFAVDTQYGYAAFGPNATPSSSNRVSITNQYTTERVLLLKGAASQSANLTEWQSSSGTTLSYVDASGQFNHTTTLYGDQSFGSNSYASAYGSAFGTSSSAGPNGVSIGYSAGSGRDKTISLGYQAGSNMGTSATNGIYIGTVAGQSTNFTQSTVIANHGTVTAANQFVAGAATHHEINNVFFGSGVIATSPISYTINGTGGSGTNIAGGNISIAGGKGTGNASGGSVLIQTSDTGSSGATLQSLTTKLSVVGNNIIIGGNTTASELRFLEPSGSGTNYTAFKAQAQIADVTYTLPAADGSSGQVLSTNGSGTLSWATASGGSPAGSGTEIQYRNGSSFGAITGSSTTNGGISLVNQAAASVPLIVKGAASQSASLIEIKNNSDTIVAKIRSDGALDFTQSLYSAMSSSVSTWYMQNAGDTKFYIQTNSTSGFSRIDSDHKIILAPNNTQVVELTTTGHVVIGGNATASELRFLEPSGSGTNYTAFKAQAQIADVTYTLPAADGSSGQVLSTNGNGTLSWATASGGSSSYSLLYVSTASKSITTETTDTTLIGSGIGSLTLAANYLTAGKTIRIKLMGFYSSSSVDTLTLKLKFGSTTIVSGALSVPYSGTYPVWELEILLTCRTTGVSGTIAVQGKALLQDNSSSNTYPNIAGLGSNGATVNTTTSQTINVTGAWAYGSDIALYCTNAIVEQLN